MLEQCCKINIYYRIFFASWNQVHVVMCALPSFLILEQPEHFFSKPHPIEEVRVNFYSLFIKKTDSNRERLHQMREWVTKREEREQLCGRLNEKERYGRHRRETKKGYIQRESVCLCEKETEIEETAGEREKEERRDWGMYYIVSRVKKENTR